MQPIHFAPTLLSGGMSDRLHRVLDIDETSPDRKARAADSLRYSQGPIPSSGNLATGPDDSSAIERVCLRAEREGPSGWEKALPRLTAYLDANAQDPTAWGHLARARRALGDEIGATAAASEALRLDPNVTLGHSIALLVARGHADARRWDRAAQHAEAALASQPGNADALELLVRAQAAQGLPNKGEATLGVLAQSHGSRAVALARRIAAEPGCTAEERHRWLSKAVSVGQGSERPLKELGEVCLLLQRDQDALQWFRKALQQPGAGCDTDVAQTLARLHVRAGHVDEALDVYRGALAVAPENLPLLRSYGQLLLKQGRTPKAIEVMQQTARKAPAAEAAQLNVNVAELYQSMGQSREALKAWEHATNADKESVSAWKGLNQAASAEREDATQLRALQELVRLQPQVADWHAEMARLRLESRHASIRKPEDVDGLLAIALSLCPTNVLALTLSKLKNSAASSQLPVRVATESSSASWRETLREGQPIEVYSKSAGVWLSGKVANLNADMVKIKYLLDGQLCEKILLRRSDSLRLPREVAAPVTSPAREVPIAAPAPDARDVRSTPAVSSTAYPSTSSASAASAARVAEKAGAVAAAAAGAAVAKANAFAGSGAASSHSAAAPRPSEGAPGPAKALGSASHLSPVEAAAEEARQRGQLLDCGLLEFGKVLGQGGFGAVYRGSYLGDEVAIKKLHIPDGQVTVAQIEEFRKEVENLQALRHSRLVSFIGAALIDGSGAAATRSPPALCIITEFMPNGSLHALLHQGKEALSMQQRFSMALQVSEGVAFLHGQSPPFVHRDLKSLNVVLDFALNCKLCDFGLTQSMEKTHISRKENEGGSPRYMAPEIFDSRGKITEKVDVWALGCLAVEIVTSRNPHEECSSIQQVMNKVLLQRQQPFLDWTSVCEDMRVLAELCFEFNPSHRIDAEKFLEGLRGLRE